MHKDDSEPRAEYDFSGGERGRHFQQYRGGAPTFELVTDAEDRKRQANERGDANLAPPDPDMQHDYDFSGGVRGKYAARFAEGTNLRALEPDLAAEFPDSESVNRALRRSLRRQDPKPAKAAKPLPR